VIEVGHRDYPEKGYNGNLVNNSDGGEAEMFEWDLSGKFCG
jgi:hypothetical protein